MYADETCTVPVQFAGHPDHGGLRIGGAAVAKKGGLDIRGPYRAVENFLGALDDPQCEISLVGLDRMTGLGIGRP